MSARSRLPRIIVAVVVAGIFGTLANAVAAAVVISGDKIAFALVPGRYGVAITVAVLLPIIFGSMGNRVAWISSLVLLTIVPSLLAKFVFGAGAPWHLVLSLNAVYAIAAVFTYKFITSLKT